MCLPLTPFRIEREWKHAGLSCAVVLAREGGHRCGYVRVPPGHPLHGKVYDSPDVDVHGGLTFSEIEECKEHADGQGWWFGFDCAHAGDASYDPNMTAADCESEEGRARMRIEQEFRVEFHNRRAEHYWTCDEVAAETERLADQLAALS
jgi:hypothetical protein